MYSSWDRMGPVRWRIIYFRGYYIGELGFYKGEKRGFGFGIKGNYVYYYKIFMIFLIY
jgi:hypothetical protein